MITSFQEIINLIILTAAIGYIFTGFITKPGLHKPGFNWEDFKFAVLIAAPGVVLHELAHKFVAMAFGLAAMFKVFWGGLGLAVFLKLVHSPILIIAPGYVEIPALGTSNLALTLIAFAGPAVNIILFVAAHIILTRAKHLTRTQAIALYLTKQINLLLFVINMLPIPPLDGSKVFTGLFRIISSFFSFSFS